MNQALRNELALLTAAAGAVSFGLKQRKIGIGLGLAAAAFRFLPMESAYSFRGKVAVVTGGSRGFGLAIAESLAGAGAKVFLVARDREELIRAEEQIRERVGVEVGFFAADVTHPEEMFEIFRTIYRRTGRLDLLVNNAGAITVGPITSMEREDYQAQLDIHLHAIVSSTRAVVPFFKRMGGGRILNISSVGGKIPFPHMAPYSASKFALAGFSASAGAELRGQNILITTAYPGLMRTGSPKQATFKGVAEKEFGWFLAGDLMPGLSMPADRAARTVLRAVADGRSEVIVSLAAKMGALLQQNFPEITSRALSMAAERMPAGNSLQAKAGADSQTWLAGRWWGRALLRREESLEARWNQIS